MPDLNLKNEIERAMKLRNALQPQGGAEGPRFEMAKKDDVGHLRIYDVIGPSWMGLIGADRVARALKELGTVKTLNVHINSPGGDIFEGLTIYNQLKDHAANVVVQIEALAASIASVIAMAGDRIQIAETGMVMIHRAFVFAGGSSDDLRKIADVTDTIEENIIGVYTARTGGKAEEIKGWLYAETWMNAKQTLERGFADEIVPNKAKADGGKEKKPAAKAANVAALFQHAPENLSELLAAAGEEEPDGRPVDHFRNRLKLRGMLHKGVEAAEVQR